MLEPDHNGRYSADGCRRGRAITMLELINITPDEFEEWTVEGQGR